MHRLTTFLAVCSLFLLFNVGASAQVVNLGGARQKLTTASAVRVRASPETGAAEVARLKLGTVVSADARTAAETEIGSKRDYWYRVALPDGQQGWVFGALLADYDPARRDETVRRIVEERLNVETLSPDDALRTLRRVRTIREFDERITAPHGGYRDASDYYARTSSRPVIKEIRVPTLVIHSADDPLIPTEPFRDEAIAANPDVLLVLTRRGGHVGFLSDRAEGEDRHWAENRLVDFFDFLRRKTTG